MCLGREGSVGSRDSGDNLGVAHGPVAQLVEHLDGIQGVAGATPARSTSELGYMLAGYVAGEGCFTISTSSRRHLDGEPIRKFVFQVHVEESDLPMLETLKGYLGFGSIHRVTPRKANWKPSVTYSVKSIKAHLESTIPFADRYLLPCAKREQFESWRRSLNAYAERYARSGRSICSVEGCERIVRGRGLCRIHYYRVTGY